MSNLSFFVKFGWIIFETWTLQSYIHWEVIDIIFNVASHIINWGILYTAHTHNFYLFLFHQTGFCSYSHYQWKRRKSWNVDMFCDPALFPFKVIWPGIMAISLDKKKRENWSLENILLNECRSISRYLRAFQNRY